MNDFPVPNEQILTRYKALLARIDNEMAALTKNRFQSVIRCEPGCADCCIRFSVLPLEAAILRIGIRELQYVEIENEDGCVLLSAGLCRVYSFRPVLCRTQGVPLAYIDEEAAAIEVSACQLNFPQDYPLEQDDLFFMDEVNSKLAELNNEYCNEYALDPTRRIPLADLLELLLYEDDKR